MMRELSQRPITVEAVNAAFLLDRYHDALDDAASCATCAVALYAGDQVVYVRMPEFGPRAVGLIHLRCYQGESVLD